MNNLEHIAIIMDGNMRYGKINNFSVLRSYESGLLALERIAIHSEKVGVKFLSVFALARDNYLKRGEAWINVFVSFLYKSALLILRQKSYKNFKINFIGDLSVFPEKLKKILKRIEEITFSNGGTTVNIFLCYTGRGEILNAFNEILKKKFLENNLEEITADEISENLYTKNFPDPDILIRTAGEMRLSGFLLWQVNYSEFFNSEKFWPDFLESDLDEIISQYMKRKRLMGKLRD